jgi:hypothetical protein
MKRFNGYRNYYSGKKGAGDDDFISNIVPIAVGGFLFIATISFFKNILLLISAILMLAIPLAILTSKLLYKDNADTFVISEFIYFYLIIITPLATLLYNYFNNGSFF